VTSVIVGAKRPEQLQDNIGATRLELSAEELARIDQVSKLASEYPGWMFERQGEVRRRQMGQARR
jgi:diketogulonate reductase-like aldo/keto reductase